MSAHQVEAGGCAPPVVVEDRPLDVLALLRDPHYDLRPAADFEAAAAAVEELVEAAQYRVQHVNRSWYVQTADGSAVSNVPNATEEEARTEARQWLGIALAKFGVG